MNGTRKNLKGAKKLTEKFECTEVMTINQAIELHNLGVDVVSTDGRYVQIKKAPSAATELGQ